MIIAVCIGILVLLCFLLAIANFAGERFFEQYEKYNKIRPSTNISPLEFVCLINQKFFANALKIGKTDVKAGDAYSRGVLILSNDTLTTQSLASYTIISHEMGHARQDKEGKKLKKLSFLRRFGKIIGVFLVPLLIAGGLVILLDKELLILGIGLLSGGVLIFLIALVIKLKTISIEKEASTFALDYLREILSEEEVKKCKSFLNDARLTYWADFLRTLFVWTFLTKKNKMFG